MFLVNARHTKNLPGPKSDVQECQWLMKLHTYGLLNNSFRPAEEVCVLRTYWRQRDEHVKSASTSIHRMQKVLMEMNVQIAIQECDEAIEAHLKTMEDKAEAGTQPQPPKRGKKAGSNAPQFNLRGELYRISGIDLTRIDGINVVIAQTIVTEVGLDMSKWATEGNFASWLGLCPDNRITGGKVYHRGSRQVENRAATALRMAATSLAKQDVPGSEIQTAA